MTKTVYVPLTENILKLLRESEEVFNKQLQEVAAAINREKNATLSNIVRGFLVDKVDTLEHAAVRLEGENFVVEYKENSEPIEDEAHEEASN